MAQATTDTRKSQARAGLRELALLAAGCMPTPRHRWDQAGMGDVTKRSIRPELL